MDHNLSHVEGASRRYIEPNKTSAPFNSGSSFNSKYCLYHVFFIPILIINVVLSSARALPSEILIKEGTVPRNCTIALCKAIGMACYTIYISTSLI